MKKSGIKKIAEMIENGTEIYFRGTNRKSEIDDVKTGINIISKNHSSGKTEGGMSVSFSSAYCFCYGFKYGYIVTGDVMSEGSDGEPILENVVVMSELMTNAGIQKFQKTLESFSKKYSEITTIVRFDGWDVRIRDLRDRLQNNISRLARITNDSMRKIFENEISAMRAVLEAV